MNVIISRLPSALQKNLPVIRETEVPPPVRLMIATAQMQAGTRYFRMGKAKILLSPPTEEMGWHMSISREDHYPTWDEVVGAWYALVPNAANLEGVLHLPPLDSYINIHENTFQVHELRQNRSE